MKVLQFPSYITINDNKEFSRNITGYGYMSLDIATSVSKAGIETDLITQGNITKGMHYQTVRILKRTWWDILLNFKLGNFINAIKAILNDKISVELIPNYLLYYISMGYFERILLTNKYDIVHIHGIGPSTQPIISTCEKNNVKYVVTLHGLNSFSDSIGISKEHQQIEKDFLKRAMSENIPVTVISTGIKNVILEFLKTDRADNFTIVTNGCNNRIESKNEELDIRQMYNISKDMKIALCVGNISNRKNQAQVVRSYRMLSQELKNKFVILFLGSDNTNGEFEKELNKTGQGDNLILCGNIPKDKVAFYYNQANFNILASFSEGFGLSMIEGFVHGLPTLTFSDLDAVPDLYHEKAMILVDERNDRAFAKGMETIFSTIWDKQFIENYAQNFSLEKMAESYIKVYKQII